MTFRRVWPPASARAPSLEARSVSASLSEEGLAYPISLGSTKGFLAQTELSCCMMRRDLPADVELQPLWEPLQLREVRLPNRVM
jgi:hypothetical protein